MSSRNSVVSVRLPDLTRGQIDELTAKWGCSMADVITVLVDRAYQEENPVDKLYHSIFIQQGSSQTYRVSDESRIMVMDEAWERNRLLNTRVRASYPDTHEGKANAEAEVERIKKERDW